MFKKKLLVSACTLALVAPWNIFAATGEMCIGNHFEEGPELPDLLPPTVKIVRDTYAPRLKAGQSVTLSTQITTNGGTPVLFWCVKGNGEIGTLEPLTPDFSQIKYTAPDHLVATEQVLRLIARVGDNQGYANGDNLYLHLLAGRADGSLPYIIAGTAQNHLLIYTPQGELKATVLLADGNPWQIATLNADDDPANEIAVAQSQTLYELTGEVSAATLPSGELFIIKADVDGDGTPETVKGSNNADEVIIDGIPLKVFGTSADLRRTTRKQGGNSNPAGDKGKIAICHQGKNTLYLPESAISAHLGHGDALGECSSQPTSTPTTTDSATENTPANIPAPDTTPPPETVSNPVPTNQPETQVTFCHDGSTINVPESDAPAHRTHGDQEGACPTLLIHGVNEGAGDVNGDGIAEVVAAMATQGSRVEVYANGQLTNNFDAFIGSRGVLIAVGDVVGDSLADLVTAEVNGLEIRIFNSAGVQLGSFPTTENIVSLAIAQTAVVTPPPVVTPPTAVTTVTEEIAPLPVVTTPEVTTVPSDSAPPPVVTTPTEVTPIPVEVATSPVVTTPTEVTTTPAEVTPPPVVTTPTTEVTPPPVVTPAPPPIVILPPVTPCPTDGNLDGVCNAYSQTIKVTDILPGGQVSNGILEGTLNNQGWVSNLTLTPTGKLIGGVVTGYVKNQGVMLDFEFKGMSIVGGTLGGVILNSSAVGGYFQDVTLLANTKITGGTLKGTIKGDKKSPALLEKVRVKKGSHLSGVKLGKDVKLEKGVRVEQQTK